MVEQNLVTTDLRTGEEKPLIRLEQLRLWCEHPISQSLFRSLLDKDKQVTQDLFDNHSNSDPYLDRHLMRVKAHNRLVKDLTEYEGLKALLDDYIDLERGEFDVRR